MRVLIADDNDKIRSALSLALMEVADQMTPPAVAGYRPPATTCIILEARDADELLSHLGGETLDVMLLDWELPGFKGPLYLPLINAQMPGCKVIAMSGRPEARERSLQLGVRHFVGRNDPTPRLMQLLRELWTQ